MPRNSSTLGQAAPKATRAHEAVSVIRAATFPYPPPCSSTRVIFVLARHGQAAEANRCLQEAAEAAGRDRPLIQDERVVI
jgi:hypothetical protein